MKTAADAVKTFPWVGTQSPEQGAITFFFIQGGCKDIFRDFGRAPIGKSQDCPFMPVIQQILDADGDAVLRVAVFVNQALCLKLKNSLRLPKIEGMPLALKHIDDLPPIKGSCDGRVKRPAIHLPNPLPHHAVGLHHKFPLLAILAVTEDPVIVKGHLKTVLLAGLCLIPFDCFA